MSKTKKVTRDKSKKRKMITEGAIKAFMEHGYKNTSMDIIANHAGVSKKTIYNHFMSKENVILTIISDYLDGKTVLKEIKYDNSKSIEEQLMMFAKAEIYLVNTPEKLGLARLLTLTFIEDRDLAMLIVMKFEPNHLRFINWLKEAVEDNKLTVDNFENAASIFYSLIEGGITYPALFQPELNVERAQSVIDEVIITFLSRYS
jgi:TetR/AcrR family transcriptional regulator of autoinduction and epiphytic fitness